MGSIAGTNRGSILDCYAFNTVIGNSAVGGIAGQSDGRLERVHNGGTVRAEFGFSESGMIQGGGNVGGVTGILNGTMTASQNTGKVQAANSNAGGLAGMVNASGSIVTSSNRGAVSGKSSIGGIVGANAGTVASGYSVGTASGTGSSIGGCVGKGTGTLKNCYYLADSQSEDGGMTDLQFISGEVTYLLNGDQSAIGWYQTCGLGYPALEGQRVYYGYTTCSAQGELVYTNTPATITRPEHTDDPRDHICDICGVPVGEHKAGTGKHTCDYCGEAMSQCADENKDHKCDLCNAIVSQCIDENKDHKCDICTATLSQCADEDRNHNCDLCGKKLTDCVDSNRDYRCDICGSEMHYRNRLEGKNRWETALLTADEMKAVLGVEKFQAIIIASGSDFADALAGSHLAAVKNAPILLSWGKGGNYAYLDEANIAYIRENLAENGMVYILGGENAVPGLYEDALGGMNVKRLGGVNRFETNLRILQEVGVAAGQEILVCTGMDYADSLSASAVGKPILLVGEYNGQIYGLDEAFLSSLQGSRFTIIGGENAVSSRVSVALESYGLVERLAGENRLETSVLVAKTYFGFHRAVVIAGGGNYPDGLCGGVLACAKGVPVLLTLPGYEQGTAAYLTAEGITSATIMGGENAVSDQTVSELFK